MSYLEKIFANYAVPKSLKALEAFDATHDNYSTSFYIFNQHNEARASDMYEDERFAKAIIEFAEVGDEAGHYALWVKEDLFDLEEAAVLYIDSEYDISLVASNVRDFLKLLSYDENCFDGSYYKEVDEYEPSDEHDAYCTWLKETMDITPIATATAEDSASSPIVKDIIRRAKEQHGDAFKVWLYNIKHELHGDAMRQETQNRAIKPVQKVEVKSMEDFIDLLYLPMDDERLLGAFDAIGLDQPLLDEDYLEEEMIYLENKQESIFVRIYDADDEISMEKVPQFHMISCDNERDLSYAFGIKAKHNYDEVVSKLNRPAKYRHKYIQNMLIWVLQNSKEENYELSIRFDDKVSLKKVIQMNISYHDEEGSKIPFVALS